MANIATSKKFTLNGRDLIQTGIISFISIIVGALLSLLTEIQKAGIGNLNWNELGQSLVAGLILAGSTAITVMIHKFLDDNKIILTDVPKDVITSIKDKETTSTVQIEENSKPILTVTK